MRRIGTAQLGHASLTQSCRTRSQVTPNSLPTSSSVRIFPSSRPKRRRTTSCSRSERCASASRTADVEEGPGGRIVGNYHRAPVLYEIGEIEVVLVAHRLLEGDRVLVDAQDLLIRSMGNSTRCETSSTAGSRPECSSCRCARHLLVDRLHHVDRNADGAGLIGDGP